MKKQKSNKILKFWERIENYKIIPGDIFYYLELYNIDNELIAEIYVYSNGEFQGVFFPVSKLNKIIYKDDFDELKYAMNQILINHGFRFLNEKEILLL